MDYTLRRRNLRSQTGEQKWTSTALVFTAEELAKGPAMQCCAFIPIKKYLGKEFRIVALGSLGGNGGGKTGAGMHQGAKGKTQAK